MIFYWLIRVVRGFVWLWKLPRPRDLAQIDPNAKCPVCGATAGTLRCIAVETNPRRPKDVPAQYKIMCQHTCSVDGARWFEEPILKSTAATIYPAIPRNDLERSADAERARHAAPWQ